MFDDENHDAAQKITDVIFILHQLNVVGCPMVNYKKIMDGRLEDYDGLGDRFRVRILTAPLCICK